MEEAKKRGRPRLIPTCVLDFDDTCVNFIGGIIRLFNQRNNTCLMERDIEVWGFENLKFKDARGNEINGKDLHDLFLEYEKHGLYVGLPLLDSVKEALEWFKKLGYKVIILTARDEKYGKDTELNLKIVHDIAKYVDQVIFEKDKVTKLQELGKTHRIALFADDRACTIKDVAEFCKVEHVVLIDKPHNKNEDIGEHAKRVRNLFECVRFLKDYSTVD